MEEVEEAEEAAEEISNNNNNTSAKIKGGIKAFKLKGKGKRREKSGEQVIIITTVTALWGSIM